MSCVTLNIVNEQMWGYYKPPQHKYYGAKSWHYDKDLHNFSLYYVVDELPPIISTQPMTKHMGQSCEYQLTRIIANKNNYGADDQIGYELGDNG